MQILVTAGPDGNAGGNADGNGNSSDHASMEISYGPGTWKSPRSAGGIRAMDQRNE
ncbi:hypothetical protein AB0J48_20415 [Nocardia salmonicida]|uniref:hypothetical protein n=1 Tax=Nocardia salmonicida TaxID=53431 RepID=UPI00342C9352